MYNRIACLCAFRKWKKCQKRFETNKCKKTLVKTRKNITGLHASVYFENGPNDKMLMKTRKMYNPVTCLCAFQKWAECQKRLKSTELNKKFHNISASEGKIKDVVRQSTLSANCKLRKVSLAYTHTYTRIIRIHRLNSSRLL